VGSLRARFFFFELVFLVLGVAADLDGDDAVADEPDCWGEGAPLADAPAKTTAPTIASHFAVICAQLTSIHVNGNSSRTPAPGNLLPDCEAIVFIMTILAMDSTGDPPADAYQVTGKRARRRFLGKFRRQRSRQPAKLLY
jgi:hypothetical protein